MNSVFLTPDEWKAEVTKMRRPMAAPIDDDNGGGYRQLPLGHLRGAAEILNRRYSSCPPSTTMVCPVIQDASGEARNSTTFATSSGCPSRPNGMDRRIAL